jgi:hypothetical protein
MGGVCSEHLGVFEMEKNLLDEILPADVRTLDDLRAAIGPLSSEERALLAQAMLTADPSPAELAQLGPAFGRKVMERTSEHIVAGAP